MQNLAILHAYGDFVERFIEENYDSENTKRQYKNAILEFFGVNSTYEIKMHMLKGVTVSIAKSYINQLIEKGLGRSSIIQKRSALSSLYEDIIDTYEGEAIEVNPWNNNAISKMIRMNLEKTDDTPQGIILKRKEINELLELSKAKKRRDYLIIKLILNCGLRRDEIGQIEYGDFFQVENEWFLKIKSDIGKGRKRRQIFINDELAEELNVVGNTGKVFGLSGDRVNKIIKGYVTQIGLPDVSAHDLRHTNITYLALAGVSVAQLQKHAGHNSVNTTMRYINLADEYQNSAGKMVKW